jgi:hypothetical protein
VTTPSRFVLRPFGQPDPEQDYDLLHVLSNYQVPQDPDGNRQWLENRRCYDEKAGVRRHYIALHGATQQPVAYAALEQQGPDPTAFRMYLVFDPGRWDYSDLGEFMYQHLLRDAAKLKATRLAFVEYANDDRFLRFLHERGFCEVGTSIYNGFEIVRLEKQLCA